MPRTHRHRHGRPARRRRHADDPCWYPVCSVTGKRRLDDRADVVLALANAVRARAYADAHDTATNRREVRGYRCSACHGWHLTSRAGPELPAPS
jgi:hypothetical protein